MMNSKAQQHQKPKHKPAIITRYAVPPHVAAQHNTPVTPYSGQSPNGPLPQTFHGQQHNQNWQNPQPQTPQSQGIYPPGQFRGPGQSTHGLPTPRNSFSHSSNPQTSPGTPNNLVNSLGHFGSATNLQSPVVPAPVTSRDPAPGSHVRQSSVISSRKPSTDQSVSMRSASEADEEDVYQLLDIPDLPQAYETGGKFFQNYLIFLS